MLEIKPFQSNTAFQIETSRLKCNTNQMTGFYIWNIVLDLNGLICKTTEKGEEQL